MRKYVKFANLIIILIFFLYMSSGCSPIPDNADVNKPFIVSNSPFVYDLKENSFGVAVDEAGIVYTLVFNTHNEIIEHQKLAAWKPSCYIAAYDLDGIVMARYALHDDITDDFTAIHMVAGRGKLFYTIEQSVNQSDMNEGITAAVIIYELDLVYGDTSIYSIPATHARVRKLSYSKDKLYLLVGSFFADIFKDPKDLGVYDLASGSYDVIYKNVDNFTLMPDGSIIIAGTDGGGTFFAEIDMSTQTIINRKNKNVGIIRDMAADEHGVLFSAITSGSKLEYTSSGLGYMSLYNNDDIVLVFTDRWVDNIVYKQGFCWFEYNDFGNNAGIKRFGVSDYVNNPHKIKMLRARADARDDEFCGGYILDKSIVTSEELMLSVQSQYNAHDIFLIASDEPVARYAKDEGRFYWLNDVPYVQDYINACFPFIKEAATDADGNIWMLPIYASVDFFLVHTDNLSKLSKAGMETNDIKTSSDILQLLINIHDSKAVSYNISMDSFIRGCLAKYLRGANTLNTAEFRSFAEIFKTYNELGTTSMNAVVTADNAWGLPQDTLIYHYRYDSFLRRTIGSDSFRFEAFEVIPLIGNTDAPSATVNFICVNPNSDNLKATLEFISSIAQKKLKERNSFILEDRSTYSNSQYIRGLYEIYGYSMVDFYVPDNVLYSPFVDYLRGYSTLDEMVIKSSDKMVHLYTNR